MSFINIISRALGQPASEEKQQVDRVEMPAHLKDASVDWNTITSYFTNALSDMIRVNRFAILTRPNNREKKEKLSVSGSILVSRNWV